MQLWTWQADAVKPTVAGIDPRCPGSYYDTFPKYRPAFEWLWETLGTDQLLWCFVDESEAKESRWNGRSLWSIDVPDDEILNTIDPGVWEFILGTKATPPCYAAIRTVWGREAIASDLDIVEYESSKLKEYHEISPPRGDWRLSLVLNGLDDRGWTSMWVSQVIGVDVTIRQALLRRPVSVCCRV